VAIFDTGVDYTHPDLAPNMWRNPGETGLDDQGRNKATNALMMMRTAMSMTCTESTW
jgi:subtilisin family serine protease